MMDEKAQDDYDRGKRTSALGAIMLLTIPVLVVIDTVMKLWGRLSDNARVYGTISVVVVCVAVAFCFALYTVFSRSPQTEDSTKKPL